MLEKLTVLETDVKRKLLGESPPALTMSAAVADHARTIRREQRDDLDSPTGPAESLAAPLAAPFDADVGF